MKMQPHAHTVHVMEIGRDRADKLVAQLQRLGYVVQGISASLDQVLACSGSTPPDLVLIGECLSSQSGGPACAREIRASLSVPVVVLATSDANYAVGGEVHCLAIPFTERELDLTLQLALRFGKYRAVSTAPADEIASREQQLSAHREAYRIARLGHWSFEIASGRLEWCDELYALFGRSRESFLPTRSSYLRRIVLPEDRSIARSAEQTILKAKQPQTLTHRFLHPDGTIRWVSVTTLPSLDAAGDLVAVHGIVQDVTESKRMEESLRALNLRLDHLLTTAPVTLHSSHGTPPYAAFFVSANISDLVGFSADQFIGQPGFWTEHIHPDDRARIADNLASLQTRGTVVHEYRFHHRDGTWRWLQDTLRLVENPADHSAEIIGHCIDVTARKQAESRLSELNSALEDLVQQRTSALGESEARYRTLFDGNPVPMVLSSVPEGRIVHVNQAALRHFNYQREEVIGHTAVNLALWVRPADREHFIRELQEKGRIENFEAPMKLKDGRTVVVVHASRTVMLDGRLHAISTIRDITEHKAALSALHQSEESLRQLTNASPAGIFATDTDGRCRFVSARWSQISGISIDEARGENWARTLHPDDRARVVSEWSSAVAAQKPFSTEYRFVNAETGRTTWVLGQAQPLLSDSNEPSGYIGTITEVTEKRVVEHALRIVSTELVLLNGQPFHNTAVARLAVLLECEGAFIGRWSSAIPDSVQLLAIRLDGHTREGIFHPLAGSPCELIVREGRAQAFGDVAARFPACEFMSANGIAALTAQPLKDAQGQVRGLVGVFTRRAQLDDQRVASVLSVFAASIAAELERERSNRRFRDLFEFSIDAIVMANAEGVITQVNQRAVDLFGWSREEMLGAKLARLVPAAGDARFLDGPATLRLGDSSAELHAVRKDGSRFPVDISLSPIESDEGMVVAAAIRDLTRMHEAEALRRRAEEEIRQAQKMESIGTLAGGIAHDFNNILTGMLGFVELARQDVPADSPARQWLENIGLSGQRAKALVRQILSFSRKDVRKEHAPTRLQGVVDEALDLLRSTLPAMVQLERRIASDCPPVMADPTQIHQVLLNLCTNAWRALPEQGGLIAVELSPCEITAARHPKLRPGPGVRLAVRDNGCGMSPEVLERIFEPFFTTRATGQGTGLGLAAVHGIVHAHDGGIRVTSEPGRGSCFEIVLPALVLEAPQPAVAARSYKAGNGERLLFVDDDPLGNKAISAMLTRLNYQVTVFHSPADALAHFRSRPGDFDLVVTDFAMPVMSGIALVGTLRDMQPLLPALVVSGNLHPQQQRQLATIPRLSTLSKPLEMAELATAIAQLLEAERPGVTHVAQV